jgi:hypothetical protein
MFLNLVKLISYLFTGIIVGIVLQWKLKIYSFLVEGKSKITFIYKPKIEKKTSLI